MRSSRILLFLAAWLIVTAGGYALILTHPERGTGMTGSMLMAFAFLGGGACLLNAFAIFVAAAMKRDPVRFVRFVMWMAAAASFAGAFPLLYYGRTVYLREQEQAKAFVEQRIADAEQRLSNGEPWPATQEASVAGHPLPRILRDTRFYRYEGGQQFEVVIRVDFSGGWIYHSHRGTWYRST